MWSGFCGQVVRKTNQRLLIVVLVIAAGLVLFLGYNRAYFRGFFSAPHAVSQAELLAAKDSAAFSNGILMVSGGVTAGTGLYETTTDKTHPDGYVSARFLATQIGNKKLLVRVSPDLPLAQDPVDPASADSFIKVSSMRATGHVTSLSSKMSERLTVATAAGDEEYLPYMLDIYEYKTFGWTSVVIGGLLLLGALWGALVYLKRNANPAEDKFARGLALYGLLETILPQLDAEMAGAHTTIKRRANEVHISPHWLIATTTFRAYGARLDGLVWAYRLIVKRKMYGVLTVGTQHTLVAYDRMGQKISVQLDEAKTAEALQLLRNLSPQAIFGYDKRLVKMWSATKGTDRTAFITEAQTLLAGQSLPESVTTKRYNA